MSPTASRDPVVTARVSQAAFEKFVADHGEGFALPPIMGVIAAFNEEDSISTVLDALPETACDLPVGAIVIDDGSSDATSKVVQGYPQVHLARLEDNCGQGVAMRLGYRICAQYGAQIVVTLDADGQWDPQEMAKVAQPIVDDEADYVIGSRTLGRTESDDAVRNLGVKFFAWAVSRLTGTPISDTSSGLKAMRVEVTQRVVQRQAQYQNAELLIGAIFAGYRITERPIVAHRRVAGESKKGGNAFYGAQYAKVIAATWWRERRNRKRQR